MNEFYTDIEEPIRGIVKALRDSGVNTTCSCGREMYIEANIIPDGMLQVIHETLFNYLAELGKEIKYTITITLEENICGVSRCFAFIQIGGTKPDLPRIRKTILRERR